jgi:hypothetical protein
MPEQDYLAGRLLIRGSHGVNRIDP